MSSESNVEPKEQLKQLWELFSSVRDSIIHLQKYGSNRFYKNQFEALKTELNRSYKFMEAKIRTANRPSLDNKFKSVRETVDIILADSNYSDKIREIRELEKFWPELEIEFESLRLSTQSFEIPQDVPATDYRLDLVEAIRDFDNDCYPSALVMCRRAYEGSLVEAFKVIEGRNPTEDIKCKNCKAMIKSDAYMGISKLHDWALKKGLVIERLKQAGFLLTEIGAGAAHPPLTEFPRDRELAKIGIVSTITLVKQVATRTKGLPPAQKT